MRALILAAGLGKRLQPLTLTTPKPLIEVAGTPMIVRQILALKRAGIDDIVINVGHLASTLVAALGDGSRWGVRLHFSVEGPTLATTTHDTALETLGGIVKALPLVSPDGAPFLVVAGDIVTDYDYTRLIQIAQQQGEKLTAHLVLVPPPDYQTSPDMGLTEQGRITLESKTYTFSSLGVYHPRLFAGLKPQWAKLFPWLYTASDDGLTGELYTGLWFNVGTPQELERVNAALKGQAAVA